MNRRSGEVGGYCCSFEAFRNSAEKRSALEGGLSFPATDSNSLGGSLVGALS